MRCEAKWTQGRRVVFYGSEPAVGAAEEFFTENEAALPGSEYDARTVIQQWLDAPPLRRLDLIVIYDGNRVWPKAMLIEDFRRIIEKRNMSLLSNLAYEFLNQRCGSIAHYDRWGWIGTYPTVDHLAAFFERNEFGCPVIRYLPSWAGDTMAIVAEIDTMLAEYRKQRKIEIKAAAVMAEEQRKVRENVIIHVKGGVVVAVDNLPNLWTYTVDDADVKAVGEKVENCKT